MSVRIFAMTHKRFEPPKDSMYQPLQVGRAGKQDLGYQGDDTGDNISKLNCYYGELSGVYWVWKNFHEADYIGICHYRRYLINEQEKAFTSKQFEEILQHYDIITTKELELNCSYYEGYAANHHIKDLIETGKVIHEKYPSGPENSGKPDYAGVYEEVVHSNHTYFGNIMVTSREKFDAYTSWLFDIFFEVSKRIDIDSYDDYHKRVYGFISEILLLVWVKANHLSAYHCKVGMTGEKMETLEMKTKLAEYFQQKDIAGAKSYFESSLQKRPDVLMEASDVNGELKLAMQVISTCDLEKRQGVLGLIDQTQDFKKLVNCVGRLNLIATRRTQGQENSEDQKYLEENNISDIAMHIAYMVTAPENR